MLRETTIGVNQKIKGIPAYYRQTIVVVAIEDRMALPLVQSKGDDERLTWGFVQGGFNPGETPIQAAVRELDEEISLPSECIDVKKATILGLMVNEIRKDRRARYKHLYHYKLLVYIAIPVVGIGKVHVNHENHRCEVVRNSLALWSMMGRRPAEEGLHKLYAACTATKLAHEFGLLSWNCESLQIRMAA